MGAIFIIQLRNQKWLNLIWNKYHHYRMPLGHFSAFIRKSFEINTCKDTLKFPSVQSTIQSSNSTVKPPFTVAFHLPDVILFPRILGLYVKQCKLSLYLPCTFLREARQMEVWLFSKTGKFTVTYNTPTQGIDEFQSHSMLK